MILIQPPNSYYFSLLFQLGQRLNGLGGFFQNELFYESVILH